MSESNSTSSKSKLDATTEAYYLLKDKGVPLDSGDYSMRNLYKMEHAIVTVDRIAPTLPEAARVDAIMEFFDSFHHLQNLEDKLKPAVRRLMEKQLLSEEEEQKRLKEARVKALEKKRQEEHLDMIVDTDPPPQDPGPKIEVPRTKDRSWL